MFFRVRYYNVGVFQIQFYNALGHMALCLTLAADRCFYVRPADRGSKKCSIFNNRLVNERGTVLPLIDLSKAMT